MSIMWFTLLLGPLDLWESFYVGRAPATVGDHLAMFLALIANTGILLTF